jgi:predicted AAA+ superfamily ATPase
MKYQRILNLPLLLQKKSFFLFGPRGAGKSFLIREQFANKAVIFDLLRTDLLLRLSANPHEIEAMINAADNQSYVIIDEIQKIPELLNEVHRLIEERRIKFLLTGSSARKLKRKNVNLLAGRAWQAELLPLTSYEIPKFDLIRYLHYGGLPAVYQSKEPIEELYAYVNTYLKEEIQAEALVRKLPAFMRFLQTASLTNGETLNFTSLASDTSIPAATIREYYQILEDTFIGFLVPAWQKTTKRKPVSTAKFYFFDIGVKNILAQIERIEKNSDIFGNAFEHFIALELRAFISYKRLRKTLSYWRTQQDHEVDFIIGDDIAIEVKAANKISKKHLKGLQCLAEEKICKQYYLISQDPIPRKENHIVIQSWQDFLQDLWAGKILL